MILAIITSAFASGGYVAYVTDSAATGIVVGFVVGILTMWIWLSIDKD